MVRKMSLVVALMIGLVGVPAQVGAHAADEIKIVRDQYGVPHVYAPTAEQVSYGAGYALAQDRLWQMHILRLLTKGNLSHLLGDLIVDADMEARFWLYTAEERAARLATYPADIVENLEAWRDGINAWIDQINADPINKMPFEFVEYAELPIEPWTLDDSIAISDYLIWTFGSGGGRELSNLNDLQRAIAEHGETLGRQLYDEVRYTLDPDAPPSIPEDFDWRNEPTHARPEADNKTLEDDARLSLPEDQKVLGPADVAVDSARLVREMFTTRLDESVLSQVSKHAEMQEALRKLFFKFGSNAQIVDTHRTTTGNTALQAGPQVSYFAPGILVDFGLHSEDGKLDATGMTFAGAGPAVLIGRGNGYNWTTTTGDSDLTDTYIEVLHPTDDRAYLFDADGSDGPGEPVWERMECRTESYKQKGVEIATQEICRTRHGPVMAFDLDNRRAYSARMAWMNREGGTVEGFWRYGEAKSLEDFATYANLLASNHNMFYADDQGNIGYWHPGNHPIRPEGYDLRFPVPGTGDAEWEGLYPAQLVPHAVNHPSGVLANWNNKPAFDWPRERGWGAYHDVVQLQQNLALDGPIHDDPWGGQINVDRQVDFQDLNANIRHAAFRHDDADFFQRYLPTSGASALEDEALEVLADYDGFIIDRNEDGLVDSAGYTILDRFVSKLRSQVLYDDLGSSLRGMGDKSKLIHALDPDSRFPSTVDFLNGQTVEQAAARAFTSAVNELSASYSGAHPRDWKREQPMQHYTRLNADMVTDVVRQTLRAEVKKQTGLNPAPLQPGGLPVPPGNFPDHQLMDRGTYNHLIVYLDEPSGSGVLGESRARHGSVISAGQNGFVNILGQEGPHSRDQWDLYVEWRYKPMPMKLSESLLLADSIEVLHWG